MKPTIAVEVSRSLLVFLLSFGLVCLFGGADDAVSQASGPVKQPVVAALPEALFIMYPPQNAIDIIVARQTAEQGKPIVVRGRVGGAPAPISDNRAIFLVSDFQLPLCNPACGCPTPWDACCQPRDMIMANVATIQIADSAGRPLKANLKCVHGLSPMAEVVVKGTVARKDRSSLLVNAQHIYVKPSPQ